MHNNKYYTMLNKLLKDFFVFMFKKLSKVHLRARGNRVSFYLHHFPHKVYIRIVIWTRTRQENKIILHYTEQTCLASLKDILMQSAWSPSKPC